MRKFEYKSLQPSDMLRSKSDTAIDVLNELGDEGWQLVTVMKIGSGIRGEVWFMMREKFPDGDQWMRPDRRTGG